MNEPDIEFATYVASTMRETPHHSGNDRIIELLEPNLILANKWMDDGIA
jgi:hypothetical protein